MKVAIIIFIFLLTPFVVITAFRKYQLAKNIGTVVIAYAVGVLLSFLFSYSNFLSEAEFDSMNSIRDNLMSISIILAIPLMLFSSNFKVWMKSLPKAVAALITGVSAIIAAVIISFFIFKNSDFPAIKDVASMITGIYIGGTMNFSAVGSALQVDKSVMTLTLTFEMLIIFPFLLFITAGGYKLFRWLLPFKDMTTVDDTTHAEEAIKAEIENYDGMFSKKVFPKTMLGFLLSVGFLAVGAGLSFLITKGINELVVILTITTLAIAASFNSKIRSLPRTFELGMFFILIFSVIVASKFDATQLNMEVINLFLFILSITLISIVLYVILCRIFRVSGDLFTVGIIALFCSAPFIPPLVSAMKNRKVLISGITIGLVGYATGTYLGVLIYYLLGLF